METTLIGRRAMMRGALAVAGSTAAAALLAACGSGTATDTPKAGASAAATTAPATGAPTTAATTATTGSAPAGAPATAISAGKTIPELRIAVAALPDAMDPQESISNVGMRIHYFTFDTLIRRDFFNNSALVPSLATEWKRTDDKTLEMTLRKDVLWHDGTPFTAADVKYTFDRIIGKDPKLEVATPGYFPLDSVTMLDDYRVRFVSTAVDPVLEKRFAGLGAQIIPAAYHKQVGADAFRLKPIGTGPYKMVEFVTGDHMTFESFDKYFGGAPAAKKVTIKVIGETATRMSALINGEVDIATNVPPDQIASLKGKKDVVIKQAPLANIQLLRFDMKVKPMDNRFVRQAINLAIDRKTLTDALWSGNAIYTRGFQYEGEDYYNAARPLTPFDPAKAKMLLQQGGYANEQITYLAQSPNYYTFEKEAAQAIIEMWKAVGINGKLELVEGTLQTKTFQENTRQITTWSATSGTADPDGYLWRNWGPDNLQQKNGWWSAESAAKYNQLGTQARSILDKSQRFDLYQQMLTEWETEAPGTTLYIPKESYGLRSTIDWTPYPLYYMDLRAYNFKIR
ncbi:MAG: ABC transporter substrate-binding protein [Chloroflexota bacterium]|nr:ABC transporter substrate-binding protein [Chloroflexota bacterium]